MPDIIEHPTRQDLVLADTQRWYQAGLIAVSQVGPEPEQGTRAWSYWHLKVLRAADQAFRRLN